MSPRPQGEDSLCIRIGILGWIHDQHGGWGHLNDGRQLQPKIRFGMQPRPKRNIGEPHVWILLTIGSAPIARRPP